MPTKECPHCGAILSHDEIICSCGFNFPLAGSAGRGSKAARDVAARITGSRKALWAPKGLRGKKKKKPPRKVSAKVIEPGTPPHGKPSKSTPPRGTSQPITPPRGTSQPNTSESGTPSTSGKLMACPTCLARISKRAERCPKCGKTPFAECQICGAKIRLNSSVCAGCGDPDPFNP